MPHPAQSIDPARIRQMVHAALGAYDDDAAAIAGRFGGDWLPANVSAFSAGDIEGFVTCQDEDAIVAFRGSQTLGDWIYNAAISLVDWPGGGKVHEGFSAALDAVWPEVRQRQEALPTGKKLWFCGHSLGGALALLGAERLRRDTGRIADGVFTFGMPKLANAAFMEEIDRHFTGRTFFFLNQGDPVPWLPAFQDEFEAPDHGIFFDGTGKPRQRPGMLEAALLFLTELLDKRPENLLEFKPHSKEEYVRIIEKAFAG